MATNATTSEINDTNEGGSRGNYSTEHSTEHSQTPVPKNKSSTSSLQNVNNEAKVQSAKSANFFAMNE